MNSISAPLIDFLVNHVQSTINYQALETQPEQSLTNKHVSRGITGDLTCFKKLYL